MIISNKDHIDELIAGFLSGGATPGEQESLLLWIESDIDHRRYYEQMYKVWLSSAQIDQLTEPEEQALLQTQKKISGVIFARPAERKKNIQRTLPEYFLRYAAAALLLIMTTYAITRYTMNRPSVVQVSETTYEAHYGSRAFAILSDSSKVWLNSGSKLTVQSGYNARERIVQLSGEAYFEVKTNPEKHFIVKAGTLSITATGTSFNVKAYPEEAYITTTLVEGTTFIEGCDGQANEFKLKMIPSQSVSYNTRQLKINESINPGDSITNDRIREQQGETGESLSPISISHVSTEALTSWMKDRWIIDNEDFGSLAIKLERRYNVHIKLESEELKNYRFTGTIERETLEQMFDVFRYSVPFQYTVGRGVITLTIDKALEKQYEKAWRRN